jgi:hypothetical protein
LKDALIESVQISIYFDILLLFQFYRYRFWNLDSHSILNNNYR